MRGGVGNLENASHPTISDLVDLLARLDTLHDFCGDRNKSIKRDLIIEEAAISPDLVKKVKVLLSHNAPKDTAELIDQLIVYKKHKGKSFEWDVLELVLRARAAFGSRVQEVHVTVSEGFTDTAFKRVLLNSFNLSASVDQNRFIIDKGFGISQDDVMCKTGRVAVTNATYFDYK